MTRSQIRVDTYYMTLITTQTRPPGIVTEDAGRVTRGKVTMFGSRVFRNHGRAVSAVAEGLVLVEFLMANPFLPAPDSIEDLSSLPVSLLRKRASEAKVPGWTKMRKDALVTALRSA